MPNIVFSSAVIFVTSIFLKTISPERTDASGGEKKMVAIARSLATLPKYLLLDEAFEGLAPIVVDRFKDAIEMIKNQGIGVIIAESNVAIATKIAEKLYMLEKVKRFFTETERPTQ